MTILCGASASSAQNVAGADLAPQEGRRSRYACHAPPDAPSVGACPD